MVKARGSRVLHVIGTVNPAAGGPSELIRVLLGAQAAEERDVVASLDDPDAPFLRNLPFSVHALGQSRSAYGFSLKLYKWIRANRSCFDGVVIHGLWTFASIAAVGGLGGRVPYVVFSHGMLDPYFKHAFPRKHLKKWVYWLAAEYWVLRGAHRVLFTTETESQLARQSFWLHHWRAEIVSLGASRPPRDGASLCEAFLATLPHMRGRRFMLYLGRIHQKKGCDLLLQAFATCATLDPDLHLMMAGPDQQTWSSALKDMVADAGLRERVHWPGMLEGEVKWGAFFACEVFILPSHQENFGIAVAEALACGRAVLLSDKVNIEAEIACAGAGLVEPDTQQGTNNLIRRWIAMTPHEREQMSAQATSLFNERYDLQRNTAAIHQLFDLSPSSPRRHDHLRDQGKPERS